MKINNWNIFWIGPFKDRFNTLLSQVKDLSEKDPGGYKNHPDTKLLASIVRAIEDIAQNPFDEKFRLGNTLGKNYSHWRRAVKLLPKRYRLFFRAHTPNKTIILCWINDENTLRKKGSKNDVYAVFGRMLDNESIPDDIDELMEKAEDPPKKLD